MSDALKKMVERLEARRPGASGYVTNVAELKQILNEITELVPVGINLNELQYSPNDVSVTIKVGFTIEKDLL